ncbi:Pentatricopeptide repeat-containing protein long [Phytophthora infestans]|uniref:Pentatricopeptide repeat-containing protein long n=1 Tax=Phytophthora infestans TaxID=4787 RepID=A0A833RT12_PHYIN|nr:Pentatricopeptide repeat-containing protein long [Phytophthora infestans]
MLSSSVSRSVVRRVLLRGLSSSVAPRALPSASVDVKLVLERSIARRESSRALAAFDKLEQDASLQDPQLLQRLALLVAKRGQPHEAPRAAQILRHLLSQPNFEADDATQLAAIYTMDSCLRVRRLEDALSLFQAAKEKDILVDLPAVNAMLEALVDAHRVDEAATILKSIAAQHDVNPTEQTFQPVLVAVMQQKRYEDVVAVIEHGRTHGVDFSPETYDPLVDLSLEQYTKADVERLGIFMEYINSALDADGYWNYDEDDEDDDGDFEDDEFEDFDDEFD